ncbi:hypothetical protein COCNU_12G000050 [Cocos nucifera]|uniref:Uncharacterized protein n=1 Tax=Cocos nucifera TaxID=13894 RepID=A0A8K0IQH7_COCNU|nr:hypothetical protein COCNU_12G000050 [Cocos nucifera]
MSPPPPSFGSCETPPLYHHHHHSDPPLVELPLMPLSSFSIIIGDPWSFRYDPLSIAIDHDGTEMPSSFHPCLSVSYVQFSIRGAVGAYFVHLDIDCLRTSTASIYSIDGIYSTGGIYSTSS